MVRGHSCEPEILRRHHLVLKHEPQSRQRVSIDPRLLDLDAIRTIFILHVPESERCFHDSAPFLALVVRDCALYVLEPDVSFRVAKHGPTIRFFPVVLALAKIHPASYIGYVNTHQQTRNVGSCFWPVKGP